MPVIEAHILEQKLLVKSGDGEEHVKKVIEYVNSKVEEVRKNSKAVSTLNAALLAAMNIADDYFETKERLVKLEDRARELAERIGKQTD
ncbi:MAG: cell division protein ZapA [Deltaproteobacteria bacterium]|nr:cell division protein ZapA [Deltaproteobacteria bacterium]